MKIEIRHADDCRAIYVDADFPIKTDFVMTVDGVAAVHVSDRYGTILDRGALFTSATVAESLRRAFQHRHKDASITIVDMAIAPPPESPPLPVKPSKKKIQ